MFGFLFFIFGIVGFLYLKSKIKVLQNEVNTLKSGHGAPLTQVQQVQSAEVPQSVSTEMQQQTPSASETSFIPKEYEKIKSDSDQYDRFVLWLKKDFMVKMGALLLLIAFGWFVSYAFANNWIGPAGRITLGLLAGVVFLILGVCRIGTQMHQGAIFTVLGSTVVLLTTFAAREIYGFFTPESALFIMFLSIVFVAFVSVQYNSHNLALAGLVLAGISPLLTNAHTPDAIMLFLYLIVIVLGTIWVVFRKGWGSLTFAALIVVLLHGLPFIDTRVEATKDIALLFAFMFTAIFFVANVASIIFHKTKNMKGVHIVTGIGTALYLMMWIIGAAGEEWQSLLFVAWMFVFILGTYVVYHGTKEQGPFYVYGASSIALLGAATAVELDGPILTLAYTIEIGAIIAIVTALVRKTIVTSRVSWLFVVPVLLSFESIASGAWRDSVIHDDFFVLLVLTFSLFAAGFSIFIRREPSSGDKSANAGQVLMVISTVYAITMIWLVMHALFIEDTATMFALFIYTVLGITAYFIGKTHGYNSIKVGGGILVGLVIARLLLVEVWQMELAGRIITFFAIGMLLISTAFIGKKNKDEALVENNNQ